MPYQLKECRKDLEFIEEILSTKWTIFPEAQTDTLFLYIFIQMPDFIRKNNFYPAAYRSDHNTPLRGEGAFVANPGYRQYTPTEWESFSINFKISTKNSKPRFVSSALLKIIIPT